jgi:hypothetical protein
MPRVFPDALFEVVYDLRALISVCDCAVSKASVAGTNGQSLSQKEIECSIPSLSYRPTLITLRDLLEKDEIEVLIIDPAYLTLLDEASKASNMFAMGQVIGQLVDVCASVGTQVILIHHTNSRISIRGQGAAGGSNVGEPPSPLASAGIPGRPLPVP